MRIYPRLMMAGLAALTLGSGLAWAQENQGSGAADKASEATDKAKAALTPGEFTLTGSDVKTINDSGKLRRYRICAKKEHGGETDLKVTHDEHDTTVKPGHCETVSGKKIEATAATTLAADQHIMGTYHRVTRTARAHAEESPEAK